MGSRRFGLALIAIGLVGLLGLAVVGAVGPRCQVPGRVAVYGPDVSSPGWWSGMHGWMHGGPPWAPPGA